MAIKALLFLLAYLLLVTVRVSSFEEEISVITEYYHGEAPAPTPEKHHQYLPPKKAPAHAPKPPHVHPPVKAPAHAPKPPHVHPPVKAPAHSPKPHVHPPMKPPVYPPVKAPAHSPKPHIHPPVKAPAHSPKPHVHPPVKPPVYPPVKAPIHPPMPPIYPPVKAPIHPPMPPVYPPVKAPISPPWPPVFHGCSGKCVEYCKGKQDQRRRCQRLCSACCYKSKCVPEKTKVCTSWGHVIYHGRFAKCP